MTWILAAVIAALLIERHLLARAAREEQATWRLERASLLQRIQAPVLAVHQHDVPESAENPQAVSTSVDEDYWDAQKVLARMDEIQRSVR